MTFLAQISPKINFWWEIQKTNVGIRTSFLEAPCVPTFRQKEQLWLFGSGKWILGLEFQKYKSGFGISTSKIPCEPIFIQSGQLWIFRPKFGKITQLRAIIWFEYCGGCCRELSGGWNELGGGGWSWLEVGAQFSNTRKLNEKNEHEIDKQERYWISRKS